MAQAPASKFIARRSQDRVFDHACLRGFWEAAGIIPFGKYRAGCGPPAVVLVRRNKAPTAFVRTWRQQTALCDARCLSSRSGRGSCVILFVPERKRCSLSLAWHGDTLMTVAVLSESGDTYAVSGVSVRKSLGSEILREMRNALDTCMPPMRSASFACSQVLL